MPIYEVDGKRPEIGRGTWIAPSAEIIGDVTVGDSCYIGFGAVIRADFGPIRIGHETAIEEGVIVHEGRQVIIGNRVIVGHMAMIHDADIRDGSLVGMQSMVCEGAVIEEGVLLAESSLVRKNQVLEAWKIYGGRPAKEIGSVESRHREMLAQGQKIYASLAGKYLGSFRKTGWRPQ